MASLDEQLRDVYEYVDRVKARMAEEGATRLQTECPSNRHNWSPRTLTFTVLNKGRARVTCESQFCRYNVVR